MNNFDFDDNFQNVFPTYFPYKKNMNTRRNFLKIGSAAVIGGLLLPNGKSVFGQSKKGDDYFPIPAEVYADSINSFTYNTFEPLVGSTFEISNRAFGFDKPNWASVSLRLVEVVRAENNSKLFGQKSGDCFSLIFEEAGGRKLLSKSKLRVQTNLPDKIYKMAHPNLGEFSLFISTVGRSGKRYQAVINRVYN